MPESAAPHTAELLQTIRELERWGAARGWVGTDPYEGLNATRFATPFRGSVTGRKILLQRRHLPHH